MDLTFGIELEFICIYHPAVLQAQLADADEMDRNVHRLVYVALRKAGLQVAGFESAEEIEEINLINDPPAPYSRWRLADEDLDLLPDEWMHLPRGYETAGLELISRKFNLHQDDWRTEIANALNILLQIQQYGCWFIINERTDFHVHVGNGDNGFSLRTVKNLFEIMTALERSFDELHAAPKIRTLNPTYQRSNGYENFAIPLSWFHPNNRKHGERSTVFQWLESIEMANSYTELGNLFREARADGHDYTGHNASFNLDNLFEGPIDRIGDDPTRTIEFRQHAGTLDIMEIEHWIVMVTTLVGACGTAKDETMIELCFFGCDVNYTMEDLLRGLELPKSTADYYSSLITRSRVSTASQRLIKAAERITTGPSSAMDRFVLMLESKNELQMSREIVHSCIEVKLESGGYGIRGCAKAKNLAAQARVVYRSLQPVLVSGLSDAGMLARARTFRDMHATLLSTADAEIVE